jgi:hypothetical protein
VLTIVVGRVNQLKWLENMRVRHLCILWLHLDKLIMVLKLWHDDVCLDCAKEEKFMEALLTKEVSIIDENVHALDKVGFFYDELLE